MNKAELESKHLSELHTLAADAGVERYRMLPRAELIEKLADGGGDGGGSVQRARPPRERQERSSRGGGRGRGGGGRQPRGGGDRQSRGGGDRQPRGGGERQPRGGDRQRRPPEGEEREQPAREQAPAPASPSGDGPATPKRRRRRRRFRKGGRTIGAGELILAAPGGQSILYCESRQSCTSLLRELAAELSVGRGPDPIALLVDPSPEELADWKREAPKAEIVSAGKDRHAEDAIAQAVRRAEGGDAVILLIDSISRLAESFGSNVAKDLLEEGRGLKGGGSGTLTVVAAVERS